MFVKRLVALDNRFSEHSADYILALWSMVAFTIFINIILKEINMKKASFMLVIVIGLYSCQQPDSELTIEQRDNITAHIKQLSDATYEAGNQKDAEKVYANFDDNTTGILNGSVIDSWSNHKNQGISFFNGLKEVKYSVVSSQVDVLSSDIAIGYGQYKFDAVDASGNQMTSLNGWTWVWNRQGDNWKIVHVHISNVAPTPM